MDINELWQKMQGEFSKQNERLDKITITFKEGERICEFTK